MYTQTLEHLPAGGKAQSVFTLTPTLSPQGRGNC
jgi:hypothetical protein